MAWEISVYTKLKAVDPEEHGVMDELVGRTFQASIRCQIDVIPSQKRIQNYNGKILAVTNSDSAKKADEREPIYLHPILQDCIS